MKYLIPTLIAFSIVTFGQNKPAAEDVSPDTVVLKIGERSITAAEFNRLIANFQPEIARAARSNPRAVMQSYFLMQSLSKRAMDEKLDQTSPIKEQLEIQKMQFLATQFINRQSAAIQVNDEDKRQRYEEDKATKYDVAKIRGILIRFTDPKVANAQVDLADPDNPKVSDLKGVRLESEANNLAQKLVVQLRQGADFEKLAREYSDDKGTAAKGGDFGTLRHNQQTPEDVKKAVFALKEGEISDPVKQPIGFYILKLEKRSIEPYEEVQRLVENEIRQERFQHWMSDQQKQFEVEVESPDFFVEKTPQPVKKTTASNSTK